MSKEKNLQKVEFARKIKAARDQKRITQEEIAEALGLSKQAISDWENEEKATIPKGAKLDKLYKLLDLSNEPAKPEPAKNKQEKVMELDVWETLQGNFRELMEVRRMNKEEIERLWEMVHFFRSKIGQFTHSDKA